MVPSLILVYKVVMLPQFWGVMAQNSAGEWLQSGWFPNSIYYFSMDQVRHSQITRRCKQLRPSAEAVTILSARENYAIYTLFPYSDAARRQEATKYYWIGLQRDESIAVRFKWMSLPAKETMFTNWKAGRPGSTKYVNYVMDDGRWHGSTDITHRHRYICEDVHPCSDYCKNGGTCVLDKSTGDRTCECTSIWRGPRCTEDGGPCHSDPCFYGGECTNMRPYWYHCACPPMRSGGRCELDFDECDFSLNSPYTCNVNGTRTCFNSFAGFTCVCRAGFKGDRCAERKVSCSEHPCKDMAFCLTTDDGFRCQCPAGFGGEDCELSNACSSTPCLNGGTCVTLTNSDFTCRCTAGWSGDVCEVDVNECVEYGYCSAFNCVNRRGSYSCSCPDGFTGPQCDTDINECRHVINACYGRGRCLNVMGPPYYVCECQDGYDPASRCAIPSASCSVKAAAVAAVTADTSERSTASVVAILAVTIAEIVMIAGLSFVLLTRNADTARR